MKIPNKHNPFTTPPTYFEEFSQHLKTKLSEEQLPMQKESGFKVPNDYFETLSSRISTKLKAEESKVIQLKPKKFYYTAVAAVAAAFLLLFLLQWNSSQEATWKDVVNTDIETYFDTYGLELTSYEIAEVIPIDDLEITNFIATEPYEEPILDYLSEHTDDFEELNLEDDE